jgi:hypothetical protein
MTSSPSTTTSPLGGLIGRHRSGRSDEELADASGGVVSPSQWRAFQDSSAWDAPAVDLTMIAAVALALGLSIGTVQHYVLASRPPAAR